MITKQIANLKPLETAFAMLEGRLTTIRLQLYQDYKQMLATNVLYRKGTVRQLTGNIIFLLLAGLLLFLGFPYLGGLLPDFTLKPEILELCRFLTGLIIFSQMYGIYRWIYSRNLERYEKQVHHIGKELFRRLEKLEDENFLGVSQTAVKHKDLNFQAAQENDLGASILRLRKRFAESNYKADIFRRIFTSAISIILYFAGFWVCLLHKEAFGNVSVQFVFWATAFGIYIFFITDMILLQIGGYLGKALKPVGCLMVLIYGIFMYTNITPALNMIPLAEGQIPENLTKYLNTGNLVILIQVFGMLISVLSADYAVMKQKWENGFILPLVYGEDKNKTRFSLVSRLFFSGIVMGLAWYASLTEVFLATSLFWWIAMPLMKPFGSTLYAYWGFGKGMALEVTCSGWFLLYLAYACQALDTELFRRLGIIFLFHLVIAGIVKKINDETMYFAFMQKWV